MNDHELNHIYNRVKNRERLLVKVVDAQVDTYWYANYIGKEFVVCRDTPPEVDIPHWQYLLVEDVVDEEENHNAYAAWFDVEDVIIVAREYERVRIPVVSEYVV